MLALDNIDQVSRKETQSRIVGYWQLLHKSCHFFDFLAVVFYLIGSNEVVIQFGSEDMHWQLAEELLEETCYSMRIEVLGSEVYIAI